MVFNNSALTEEEKVKIITTLDSKIADANKDGDTENVKFLESLKAKLNKRWR